MYTSRLLAASVLAVSAGLAHADTSPTTLDDVATAPRLPVTFLGYGTDFYKISGSANGAFEITLPAGSYEFTSNLTASGQQFTAVWLSFGKDANPNSPNGNDIDPYEAINNHHYTESYGPLVLTEKTNVFIDIKTNGNVGGSYKGFVAVTAVPEPATSAMLLAGLGMIGFMGRRRRG